MFVLVKYDAGINNLYAYAYTFKNYELFQIYVDREIEVEADVRITRLVSLCTYTFVSR